MILRLSNCVISVSEKIRQMLVKNGVDGKGIVTIRNVPYIREEPSPQGGMAFRRELGISEETRMIGFVGRLEPVKGCDLLIQAAPLVLKEAPDTVFIIVGDGRDRAAMETEVREQGLEEHVRFCGFRADIHDVFAAMDLFVMPSRNEGIPLVLLEAMYFGVLILATDVGGVPEVIEDGRNGTLVPPEDVEALVGGICALLADREKAERMIREGKETILREFTLDQWIGRIEDLYDEVKTGQRR